jgi:hypothetical protein
MTTARVSSGLLAPSRIRAGIVGGLVGGIAFGVLMQTTGVLAMVAMLVGSGTVAVGWLVHLAISAFIGATFGVLFGRYAISVGRSTAIGIGYGLLWWILGGLILMPAKLGMDVFVFSTMAWQSLLGHLVYGLLLGAVYALGAPRLQRR